MLFSKRRKVREAQRYAADRESLVEVRMREMRRMLKDPAVPDKVKATVQARLSMMEKVLKQEREQALKDNGKEQTA
jgi:hypothetical protein